MCYQHFSLLRKKKSSYLHINLNLFRACERHWATDTNNNINFLLSFFFYEIDKVFFKSIWYTSYYGSNLLDSKGISNEPILMICHYNNNTKISFVILNNIPFSLCWYTSCNLLLLLHKPLSLYTRSYFSPFNW